MARYVDGFVLPVPRDRIEAYRELAQLAGEIWLEYGALEVVECIADDVQEGEVTSFPRSVKLAEGETVVFAWIAYTSREQRDRVNEQVMRDPRLADMSPETMPFDTRRMFWGGFRTIVELGAGD